MMMHMMNSDEMTLEIKKMVHSNHFMTHKLFKFSKLVQIVAKLCVVGTPMGGWRHQCNAASTIVDNSSPADLANLTPNLHNFTPKYEEKF